MKITIPANKKQKWLEVFSSALYKLTLEEGEYINSTKLDKRIASFLLGDKQCIFRIKNIKGDKDLIINTLQKGEKVKIISKSAGFNKLKQSAPRIKGFGTVNDIVESDDIKSIHKPSIYNKYTIIVIEGDFFLAKDLKSYD